MSERIKKNLDLCGYASGEKFQSDEQVLAYFTRENFVEMFGKYEAKDWTDDELAEMAHYVLANRIHME